ncbi:MAG: hypothetical protein J5806_11760 [Lentisphaeria bacterium]|nr:hypothetical protein [Lentisphaeria bacterium]
MFVYIVLLFLLLPALVLWAVPKTRRSAGDTVTAWKTVPFGCVTMLVLPNVLAAILFALAAALQLPVSPLVSVVLSLGLMIFSVTVGIRVITLLKNYIRKRYGTETTAAVESKKPYYFAFGCLAAVLILLLFVPFIWFMSTGEWFSGHWRTYPVVTEHGTELAFQERPIHPFLAEYEYRFRFRKDGTETTYQDLWINTGGRTFFNVFRLKNGRLLFSDKDKDYIVEVKTREVYMLQKVKNQIYAGLLPAGKFESYSYGVEGSDGKTGKVVLRIKGNRIEMEPVTDQLTGPEYIGCITTGFHPASEKPYQPVEKMRGW